MSIDREPRLEWIALEALAAGIQPRSIQEQGVRRLVESMQDDGFLPQFPIVVSVMEGGYRLLAGHHRVEAARRIPCVKVPALVYTDLTSDEEWHLAVATNRAHEAATPPTFVDDTELVWKLMETGKKQDVIASIMGWKSNVQVSQYYALKRISPEGWKLILTTFEEPMASKEEEVVKTDLTTVKTHRSPFNEGILREIVSLTHSQQVELIKLLVKDPHAKADYRKTAERYKARNNMKAEAEQTLRALPHEMLARALEEIDKGYMDKEWLAEKVSGERFQKLMQQLLDEHAEKQSYRLYEGACADIAAKLEPESVDVIVTDPPYGEDYLDEYKTLASIAGRLLRPGGSLVVMCGQYHLLDVGPLLRDGLKYHWCLTYLTPGHQAAQIWSREVNTFWKPVLWFVKEPYTGGKWLGDVAKSPINGTDKRYHKWGQSEEGMADLIDRVSQPGDMICDPFMGGGSTGVAAIRKQRKFIGIEKDPEAFATAELRLAEATTKSLLPDAKYGK